MSDELDVDEFGGGSMKAGPLRRLDFAVREDAVVAIREDVWRSISRRHRIDSESGRWFESGTRRCFLVTSAHPVAFKDVISTEYKICSVRVVFVNRPGRRAGPIC